jgi:hypothetical protein
MSAIQRTITGRRSTFVGPAPECPAGHGRMHYTLGGWRCAFTREVKTVDKRTGFAYSAREWCNLDRHGRRRR